MLISKQFYLTEWYLHMIKATLISNENK